MGWRMQGWLKGQSHILKIAIMVPRKRLSRAIAATFWPRGRRALRIRRPRDECKKNKIFAKMILIRTAHIILYAEGYACVK